MDAEASDLGFPGIPAFLTKLRLLVDDEDTNDLIYWDATGNSFHICDGNRLAKQVLPLFFKHNNLSSFIRQLNMYGFRKVNRVDSPIMKLDMEDIEFRHPFFVRHKPHLLSKIQRKPPTTGFTGRILTQDCLSTTGRNNHFQPVITNANFSQRPSAVGTEFIKLSNAIKTLRTNQDTLVQQLSLMKSENQLLYRELRDLRECYTHQSQLIQTLFSFLSAFAKDSRTHTYRFSPKRKALPYTGSSALSPNTHSGLKLNLPKGFFLDDPYSFKTKTLNTPGNIDEPPFKLPRMENSGLAALADAPMDIMSIPCSSGPILPSSSSIGLDSNKDTIFPPTLPNNLTSDPQLTQPSSNTSNNLVIVPFPSNTATNSITTKDFERVPSAVKPTSVEADHTLASLTQHASSRLCSILPEKNMDTAGTSDTLGLDISMSRCTTPLSLLQTDVLDIGDLFPNRDDNVSDISLEDLFMASSNASDAEFSGKSVKGAGSVDLIDRSGRCSVDSQATIPLGEREMNLGQHANGSGLTPSELSTKDVDTPSRTVACSSPIPLSSSAFLSSAPIISPSDATLTTDKTASKTNCVPQVLPSTVSIEDENENPFALDDQELYGLPWEAQEVVVGNEDVPTGDDVDGFSADLLPENPDSEDRFKMCPYNNVISNSASQRALSHGDHNFILGHEIIPLGSAIPFANVQSSAFRPVFTATQQPVISTIVPGLSVSQRSNLIAKPQHKLGQPIIFRQEVTSSSVEGQPTAHQIFTTPISFPGQLVALRAVTLANSVPSTVILPQPAQPVERKHLPSFRPIAPARLPSKMPNLRKNNR